MEERRKNVRNARPPCSVIGRREKLWKEQGGGLLTLLCKGSQLRRVARPPLRV